ncbi:hypothetical protein SLEP1_g10081 [Rubroshorea leprosula]|uniref:NB-ARC domain-containing protein n=1 Tax=Rubroshorea leprosula TaxID=152421 RepID=A0AAV5IFI6_9ROSI|nr:hypothetical protein SLEP1_g10081 [Rubroshorea leprosula]
MDFPHAAHWLGCVLRRGAGGDHPLSQPGKIAKKEVEAWLEKADQETAERVVEDLICKGGCFTYICSSRKLDKRTQSTEGTFKQGEKYTSADESLVEDTPSIEYWATVFEEKQERIKHQKEDIEANLKTQRMQPGKIARKEVEKWLEKAGQQIGIKVEDLISQGECSSLSNLRRKIEELRQILEQGKEFTNAAVILVRDDHSIKGLPLLVEKCSGRDDIQEKILEWLKGDEVTRIAVLGMGGLGKTTIMKNVHNQLLNESKFKNVIWVTVSKDFNITVQQKKKFDILQFQKKIASSLKLEREPDHENETKLAALISQRLGQGSFLLILDDVWEPFSLEDVGISNPVGNNGCKLVLTTQSKDVARAMDCNVIHVNPLPPKEALELFSEKIGSDVFSDGKIKRDIEPFLKQILQKCGGVPLAIVTVAKSMKGKLLPRHWKLAHSEFSKFESIIDCLKFSYECLEQQCQECFLCCALYPEDYKIPKEELIEYWIEEGLIYKEGKTREAMNWKGHDILDKLVDNCLLQSVKKIDEGEEEWVSMHDLLREMALEISPQFLVKAGIALEKLLEEHEWRENLLKVSLMRNHITEIPSSMPSPKCPMLTTLLLSDNKISTIPEAFFEHMLGLKILDLSWNGKLCRLPSSISKLEKLTTLLLYRCGSLKENLKSVFDEEGFGLSPRVPPTSFFSLKEIKVEYCDQLKKVFSSEWLLHYFQSLKTIEVTCCSQMEELISSSAHEEEKVTLPKLERLELTSLPLLKSIYSSSSVLICDSIQSLMIFDCEKLNRIPLNFPLLDNAQSSHPPSLKEIVQLGFGSIITRKLEEIKYALVAVAIGFSM